MRLFRAVAVVLVIIVAALAYSAWRLQGLSTRSAPTALERLVARSARRLAIPSGAADLKNPVAFSPEVWAESRAHFADHCATCHANDGSGRTELGQALYPRAPDMREADTQSQSDGQLYWIIENGVRLTGMPAWGRGGDDDLDTWKLVHFLRHLNELTPEQLAVMESQNPKTRAEFDEEREDEQYLAGADVDEPERKHVH